MVKNNLELGKKLFKFFPELKEWLEPYIPLEELDDYVLYDQVDLEEKNNYSNRIIRGGFVIFTTTLYYSFNLRRPDKELKNGDIFCGISGMTPGEYGSNDFDEGDYNKIHFRDIMEKIMINEGIKSKDQFIKFLVELDQANFDDDEDFLFYNNDDM